MVKYQKKSIDHGYRTFTQSKNLCMVIWFWLIWVINWLIDLRLIDWALVSQIYLVQQDEEHGHYFFYNDEMKKRKRKSTLVNLKMKHHSSNFSPPKPQYFSYKVWAKKKPDTSKSWSLIKNPQFLSNTYETLWKWLPHEVIIFTKFHKDWTKIVNFH